MMAAVELVNTLRRDAGTVVEADDTRGLLQTAMIGYSKCTTELQSTYLTNDGRAHPWPLPDLLFL